MKHFNTQKLISLKNILLSSILIASVSCSAEKEDEETTRNTLSSYANAAKVDTTDHKEHDFDDDDTSPFTEDQGFELSKISGEGMSFTNDLRGGKRLKLTWKESEYDGSRRERGHELKLNVTTNDELFTGFYLSIPSGQSNNLLNKNTIIWQLYNWNSDGCSNWTAHLELQGNDLYLSYRAACVDPTVVKILEDVPTDTDLAFQIRNKISGNNEGIFVVYVDDTRIANIRDINYGFGDFDSDDNAETSVVGIKMGMYCYDTDDYTDDEIRILYQDNIGSCVRTGTVSNSFDKIDPRNL